MRCRVRRVNRLRGGATVRAQHPTEPLKEPNRAANSRVAFRSDRLPKKSSAPELVRQDSALFSQVFDDGVLMSGDPAGHRGDEHLPGLEHWALRVRAPR